MIHLISLACPKCRTADYTANMVRDGNYQMRSPNCPRCGGDGFLYRDPLLIRGLATGIRQQRYVLETGESQPGDMHFSPGAKFSNCHRDRRISRDDKFIATWDQPLHEGQTIVRGAAQIEDNGRLESVQNNNEDRLWYQPKSSLWCEDEDGVTYKDGSDFVLGPGSLIKWVGNQPDVGKRYVLKYTAFFEWRVWAPPQERVDRNNRNLGSLIFLRKKHVVQINDSPFITDDERTPLFERIEC